MKRFLRSFEFDSFFSLFSKEKEGLWRRVSKSLECFGREKKYLEECRNSILFDGILSNVLGLREVLFPSKKRKKMKRKDSIFFYSAKKNFFKRMQKIRNPSKTLLFSTEKKIEEFPTLKKVKKHQKKENWKTLNFSLFRGIQGFMIFKIYFQDHLKKTKKSKSKTQNTKINNANVNSKHSTIE